MVQSWGLSPPERGLSGPPPTYEAAWAGRTGRLVVIRLATSATMKMALSTSTIVAPLAVL